MIEIDIKFKFIDFDNFFVNDIFPLESDQKKQNKVYVEAEILKHIAVRVWTTPFRLRQVVS